MGTLSQGTSFSYNSATFVVTRISINSGSGAANQRQRVSTAHLGSDPNKEEPYLEIWQPRADEGGGNTIEIDFLGGTPPAAGSSGSLSISGGISLSKTGVTVASSVVTVAVGDLIRGSASFRYS